MLTISTVEIALPEPKAFRIDNRTLYFDSVSNRYGVFLRISQVWSSNRTAITIPGRSLGKFREIIDELAEDISAATLEAEASSASSTEQAATAVAQPPVNPAGDTEPVKDETETRNPALPVE